MTDIEKIVYGGLFGIGVYLVGQLLSNFVIEPLHELRKAVGRVRFNLAFHAPTIRTPIGRSEERSTAARDALMASSSELVATLHAVPGYRVWCLVSCLLSFGRHRLPGGHNIERAATLLRGLSTYVTDTGDRANDDISEIRAHVAEIERVLHLKPLS